MCDHHREIPRDWIKESSKLRTFRDALLHGFRFKPEPQSATFFPKNHEDLQKVAEEITTILQPTLVKLQPNKKFETTDRRLVLFSLENFGQNYPIENSSTEALVEALQALRKVNWHDYQTIKQSLPIALLSKRSDLTLFEEVRAATAHSHATLTQSRQSSGFFVARQEAKAEVPETFHEQGAEQWQQMGLRCGDISASKIATVSCDP